MEKLPAKKMIEKFFIPSPIGLLEVCIKENKLYSLCKSDKKHKKNLLQRKKLSIAAISIKKQLQNYFNKKSKKFDIPLFKRGTHFQRKVWTALQRIPWGDTTTYGQLAKQLKNPKASRAVGSCCAKNPFLLIVPCHRVLSQKGLGGFALGLKTKKKLLYLEKINILNS